MKSSYFIHGQNTVFSHVNLQLGVDPQHEPLPTILEDVIRLETLPNSRLSPSPTLFETDNDSDKDNEVVPGRTLKIGIIQYQLELIFA